MRRSACGGTVPTKRRRFVGCSNGYPRSASVLLAPPEIARRQLGSRDVGGDAAVHLVERAFAELNHELGGRQPAGAHERVEIHQTAAGRVERLVDAVQLGPQRARQEQRVALGDRLEEVRRLVERADLEQPVAVRGPVDAFEQAVLFGVVIAPRERVALEAVAQVEAERGDHRPWIDLRGAECAGEDARRADARAVDHDANNVAARVTQPEVERGRRRRRGPGIA